MLVSAEDVPRLMRTGFFWSGANVRRRCSHFVDQRNVDEDMVRRGWRECRVFHLADTSGRTRTQWHAAVHVYGRAKAPLAGFRLHHLTNDRARHV